MSEVIFRGGTILTVDDASTVTTGDLVCKDGLIAQVGGEYTPEGKDYEIVECAGCIVMPGLVQSHVHMCQSLARVLEAVVAPGHRTG